MSVKGISWIEANFEKLIVAVMLLAFLAVLTFQFVLQSNTVEVEGKQVPLADAFEPAERAAERLQSRLNETDPQLPSELATRDLASEFEQAISGGVTNSDRFMPLAEPLAIDVNISEVQFTKGEYASFEPPAPSAPESASYRATLDPYAVSEIEGMEQFLPEEQPFDTPWVSVQGTFSGVALKAAYESDPDGPGGPISPMPSNWWATGAGVVEVEVERQKQNLDGQWGPAEAVTRMPGITSLTDDLDEKATNYRQLQSLGAQAAQQEQPILRPEFVAILEGEPWVPPVEVPDPSEVSQIQSQVKLLERRLGMIDRDIQQKQRALAGPNPQNSRNERDDTGGRDEGRRPDGNNDRGGDNNQQDVRRTNIEKQITQLEERREGVVEELTDLGWQPEDEQSLEGFDREEYISEDPLLESEVVHFWTHDFDVEPGATYRYRTRLVYVNPLFGRKSSLDGSLHELADSKLVRSGWSEWGEPVGVSWDEYYFLTGASPGGSAIATASATAELYRFYYGYWRKSQVSLEPGDRFIAEIELPEGLQRWDVEEPAEGQAWKPANQDAEGNDVEVEQVEGVEDLLLAQNLVVEANAWLLDVVASPMVTAGIGGQSTALFEALVRGPDGQIATRSPRIDESLPLYSIIKASAELGEDQLPRIPGQNPRDRRGPDGGRGFDERLDGYQDPRDQYEPGRNPGRDDFGGGGGGGG
ncbi:MAG: hypothetical protein Phyf2KO_15780 [Phycisphaerales bacterium]